jgi:hypothetical protein
MTDDDHVRLRAALRIHARLSAAGPPPPLDAWRGLERAARLGALAAERGWTAAAAACRSEYRRRAAELTDRLGACLRTLDADDSPRAVQSSGEVLADLAALEAEFGGVEIDPRECAVSVTTDPVVLEGTDLGRFELAWRWDLPPDSASYGVTALDPNPAAGSESTTHPHVREEALCEGDGRTPFRRTLEQGRLFDFFLLVRAVFATYNPGSVYVPLERWSGSPCADCGTTASEDESACCDRCHADLCTDCVTICTACDRLCCSGSRTRCRLRNRRAAGADPGTAPSMTPDAPRCREAADS